MEFGLHLFSRWSISTDSVTGLLGSILTPSIYMVHTNWPLIELRLHSSKLSYNENNCTSGDHSAFRPCPYWVIWIVFDFTVVWYVKYLRSVFQLFSYYPLESFTLSRFRYFPLESFTLFSVIFLSKISRCPVSVIFRSKVSRCLVFVIYIIEVND